MCGPPTLYHLEGLIRTWLSACWLFPLVHLQSFHRAWWYPGHQITMDACISTEKYNWHRMFTETACAQDTKHGVLIAWPHSHDDNPSRPTFFPWHITFLVGLQQRSFSPIWGACDLAFVLSGNAQHSDLYLTGSCFLFTFQINSLLLRGTSWPF